MPKPHTRRRPPHRHKPHPADYTALLSRLTALEAALLKQSGPRGLAEAPAPLVRLTAGLLDETHAHLPGAMRKRTLPRLCPEHPVSHAELCVVAGQAHALLAAFISAKGLDKPPATPGAKIQAMRDKLSKLIASKIEEGVERRMAEAEAARAAEEAATAAAETASP